MSAPRHPPTVRGTEPDRGLLEDGEVDPGALRRVDAVVVGASAGGVDALLRLTAALPTPWHLPLVAVLHLPQDRESRLADIFAHRLPMAVCEARDKAAVAAGTLHFAPPGYHLFIETDHHFSLSCEPPVHFSRPSIDLLMSSAADAYGPRVAGLLLTGANEDGARGLADIGLAGGLTAVQSPSEAMAPQMPRSALALCQPDFVLPLAHLRRLLILLDAQHHAH
ncbi:chemotaxis protein CheB [uncultured Pseudacidovorax sp.]|uniref:chemotaxis protein CheB n=1 Tax=uncultured Pseudacidovorax sp. TaxID=679313 RepID=UPI0025E7987C|nr:chemotaxis protein CheB [uncultured Pseudacidovorax sp.]